MPTPVVVLSLVPLGLSGWAVTLGTPSGAVLATAEVCARTRSGATAGAARLAAQLAVGLAATPGAA